MHLDLVCVCLSKICPTHSSTLNLLSIKLFLLFLFYRCIAIPQACEFSQKKTMIGAISIMDGGPKKILLCFREDQILVWTIKDIPTMMLGTISSTLCLIRRTSTGFIIMSITQGKHLKNSEAIPYFVSHFRNPNLVCEGKK